MYNDLLMEFRATKMFKQEAVSIGMQQAAFILTEREQALREALKKLDKGFSE